jgi:hypothetical protein
VKGLKMYARNFNVQGKVFSFYPSILRLMLEFGVRVCWVSYKLFVTFELSPKEKMKIDKALLKNSKRNSVFFKGFLLVLEANNN